MRGNPSRDKATTIPTAADGPGKSARSLSSGETHLKLTELKKATDIEATDSDDNNSEDRSQCRRTEAIWNGLSIQAN